MDIHSELVPRGPGLGIRNYGLRVFLGTIHQPHSECHEQDSRPDGAQNGHYEWMGCELVRVDCSQNLQSPTHKPDSDSTEQRYPLANDRILRTVSFYSRTSPPRGECPYASLGSLSGPNSTTQPVNQNSKSGIIDAGGGRGCGKSFGANICVLASLPDSERKERPLKAANIMLKHDQAKKFHVGELHAASPIWMTTSGSSGASPLLHLSTWPTAPCSSTMLPILRTVSGASARLHT